MIEGFNEDLAADTSGSKKHFALQFLMGSTHYNIEKTVLVTFEEAPSDLQQKFNLRIPKIDLKVRELRFEWPIAT